MQGVAGASRQTRIQALLLSIRNTLFRRSCRFLILLRFRFFSSAASFCLHLFHGPGFLFLSAEAAAAPLFRFSIPFQPGGSFTGKAPGLPRHGQGCFLRIRRIPRRSRRPGKNLQILKKIITDAIAFPPPMTHNGVSFRVIRGRPPAKPPQDTGFCPQGGIPGGFHHGAPKQEAETAPTCRVISQCDAPWVWRTPEQDRDGKRGNESKRRRAGDRCWPGCRQNAPVLAASNRPHSSGREGYCQIYY